MTNTLLKLIGWGGLVMHGDPCVFDRWIWLRRHLRCGPVRTLDAGCGAGAFTIYAGTLGNDSVGLSFNSAANENAAQRAKLLGLSQVRFLWVDLRQLHEMADSLGSFDQIICFETIEHIQNDRKLLSDLSRLLKPGGRLLLTTPFKYGRPFIGDRLSEAEDGGHVRVGYTHAELAELLAVCGIEVREQDYVSGFISHQLTQFMRLLGRVDIRLAWAVTFPMRGLQVLDHAITRLLRYPYISVAVMGVKSCSS